MGSVPIRRSEPGAWPGVRGHCGGFSLVEVLVAFTILAVSMGALLQAFGGAMRSAHVAADYSRAVLLAQSKVAAAGVEEELREGTSTGRFDENFEWRMLVKPYPADSDEVPAARRLAPLEVTVSVLWHTGGQRRSLSLTTLMLAEPGSI